MGWTEFRPIRNHYNEGIQKIDEQILQLIQQRKDKTNGRHMVPPQELLDKWSQSFQMDVAELRMFFHNFNHEVIQEFPDHKGKLVSVVPIMKESSDGECHYLITHALNYEKASVVEMGIRYFGREGNLHIEPHLMLEISGDRQYNIRNHGTSGGGNEFHMGFLVAPTLPEVVTSLKFCLVPYARPCRRPEPLILDKPVDFE